MALYTRLSLSRGPAIDDGSVMLKLDDITEQIYHKSAPRAQPHSDILSRLHTPPLRNTGDAASSPDVQIIDDPSTTGDDVIKCLICSALFADQAAKMAHLSTHFKAHTEPHKTVCQVCEATVDRWNFTQHESVHAVSSQPHMLACPSCSATFDTEHELNTHHAEEHAEEVLEAGVGAHVGDMGGTAVEVEGSHLTCSRCLLACSSKEDLQQHWFSHFSAKGSKSPLICPVCNKTFTTKYATYEFKRHMCSHTGEKPIPCRFCDKKFKDYSGRSQHEKRVHNRGPLARGRRKGYKMDRDQLYTPPQPHHYLGEARTPQKISQLL